MTGTRILVVPGSTQVGAVAMAYASLHKLVEIHADSERGAHDPDTPHTVVVLRDPATVDRTTLRLSLIHI